MKPNEIRLLIKDVLLWEAPLSVRSIQEWIMFKNKSVGRHVIAVELLNLSSEGVISIDPHHKVSLTGLTHY